MKLFVVSLLVLTLGACGEDDDETTTADNFTLNGAGSNSTGLVATTPAMAKLNIYKFAVSASADCSSPITVFSDDDGVEVDMEDGPTIGSGELADGTYPCVILEMDDEIKFTTSAADGSCAASTEYSINVCRQFSDEGTITSTLIDGDTVTCTDAKEKVAVYISTNSATSGGEGSDPFNAPASANSTSGITLGSALVVSGTTSGTFRMNTANKVDGSNETCDMQPPAFSFTSGS